MPKLEIFLCSAPEDECLCGELEKHLEPYRKYGLIEGIWHSQKIDAGMERDIQIQHHLNRAGVIILLVSPDFMNSKDCDVVVLQVMQRHEKGETLVIPVIARPVDWEGAPFSALEVLPSNKKPIISTSWPSRDEAFYNVAIGIRKAIEHQISQSSPHLPGVATPTALTVNDPTESPFRLTRTIVDHLGPVACVAFSHDGELLVSDSWDNTIKIWNRDAGQVLFTLRGHVGAVYSVIFSPDMKHLASGGNDKSIKMWDVKTGNLSRTLTGHDGPISSVVFSSDTHTIISGSDDCTIAIWDALTGSILRTLTGHKGPVSSVALSFDMKMLANGSHDGTIKIWDMGTGQVVTTLQDHVGPIYSIASSSDMQVVVSGGYDKKVRVWDTSTGRILHNFIGHASPISSVALSLNKRFLVSGSHDKTIKVWDMSTGQMLSDLIGHSEAVLSTAIHPDGNTIASGSLDKTIKIWQKPYLKKEHREKHNPPSTPLKASLFKRDRDFLRMPEYFRFRMTNYILIVLCALGLAVDLSQYSLLSIFLVPILPAIIIPIFRWFIQLIKPQIALIVGSIASLYYGFCTWAVIDKLRAIHSLSILASGPQLLLTIAAAIVTSFLFNLHYLNRRLK